MTNPVACLLSCRAAPNACKLQHFPAGTRLSKRTTPSIPMLRLPTRKPLSSQTNNALACSQGCRAAPNACKIQHFRARQATETPSRSGAGPGPRRSAGPGLGLGRTGPGPGPVLTGVLEFDRGFVMPGIESNAFGTGTHRIG